MTRLQSCSQSALPKQPPTMCLVLPTQFQRHKSNQRVDGASPFRRVLSLYLPLKVQLLQLLSPRPRTLYQPSRTIIKDGSLVTALNSHTRYLSRVNPILDIHSLSLLFRRFLGAADRMAVGRPRTLQSLLVYLAVHFPYVIHISSILALTS
jgi:hypothetical protein